MAVTAFHKYVPNVPKYEDGFLTYFLCFNTTKECWFGDCENCDGINKAKLERFVNENSSTISTLVKWHVWQKESNVNRIQKIEKSGTIMDLIKYIIQISPAFLKHQYIKNEQSKCFNSIDRVEIDSTNFQNIALLQIDFSENFACEAQDETQTGHWNQKQISLFTCGLYHRDLFKSTVIVSDNLEHSKETILPFLHEIIRMMPKTVKILKIWSDGPSSQFKNKFVGAMILLFEKLFNIQIIWNYFATSHGKGCVDGIGATTKMVVRKHIKARNCLVNNSKDFVKAFNLTKSTIDVLELNEIEMTKINEALNSNELFKKAKAIKNISRFHQLRSIDNIIVGYVTSSEGNNSVSE